MNFIQSAMQLWNIGVSKVLFPILAGISVIVFTKHIFDHFKSNAHVHLRDTKRHNWKSSQLVEETTHCSLCENLLNTRGYYCDSCGVASDADCIKKADSSIKCKTVSSEENPMRHQWIKGNLSTHDHVCCGCQEPSAGEGLVDRQCCWCQAVAHSHCLPLIPQVCDLGTFQAFIVPPNCMRIKKSRSSISVRTLISSVSAPPLPNWSPIIVVANCKSGSNDGDQLLSRFRRLLNPAQAVDLSRWPPRAALQWCQLLNPVLSRPAIVLVAGGDGTVGWVLNEIHSLNLTTDPLVAIVPLGTGNDLSRVLGWGVQHHDTTSGEQILKNIQIATPAKLDRWKVDIQSYNAIYHRVKNLLMYNYLSIGVDAQVTLDFHRTRESPFYLFSSRIFNKLLYLLFGTQQVVERRCQNLEKQLELYLDGRKIDSLPEIESVVVLNIPSWGAGVDLWALLREEMPGLPEQSWSDGKLEVVAVYSSFHIAQLQVGLSAPHYIGQASSVKIKLKNKMAMQVDGEPWDQEASEINLNYVNQASVLQVTNQVQSAQ